LRRLQNSGEFRHAGSVYTSRRTDAGVRRDPYAESISQPSPGLPDFCRAILG
jgi:hypothetical protein